MLARVVFRGRFLVSQEPERVLYLQPGTGRFDDGVDVSAFGRDHGVATVALYWSIMNSRTAARCSSGTWSNWR
ncbi:hypothetical protein IU486_29355 [Streptomyces gardneri]|nr:hypothetical protein [Streptomyces gardneri]MBF6204050.1 hypothetical protein [Streptomyces gardneri]